MTRRSYGWNGFATTLSSGVDASTGTIPLVSVTSLRSPGILVIDYDDPTKREYIKFTGISSLDLTGTTRGLGGSVGGTGHAHDAGADVRSVAVHEWFDDLWSDIEDLEAVDIVLDAAITALEAADTAHFGSGGAVHQDATTSASGFMSAADKTKLANIESGATSDMTPGEILTALLGIDGDGSLLDADLLDGYEADSFLDTEREGAGTDTNQSITATDYGTNYGQINLDVPSNWVGYRIEVEVEAVIQKAGSAAAAADLDIRVQVEDALGAMQTVREFTNLLANDPNAVRMSTFMTGRYGSATSPLLRATNTDQLLVVHAKSSNGDEIFLRQLYTRLRLVRMA